MALFCTQLLNGPFGDAALLLENAQSAEKILFDLGDLRRLNPRDLTKISPVFVTHAHMDHFSGFEQLLRPNLNRAAPLHLFGPRHFIRQVAAKLQGFTWNLITDPCYTLEIVAHEVTPRQIASQSFRTRDAFKPVDAPVKRPFDGILYHTDAFTVTAAILDHGTPVLGLALTEARRFNIQPQKLAALGLRPGPWLQTLKTALAQNASGTTEISVTTANGQTVPYTLTELRRALICETPPHTLAYITDLAYSPANIRKVRKLAYNADMLFMEAAFLDEDREMAAHKKHLTAKQAGELARLCGAKRLEVFHFSERYNHREAEIRREAAAAFGVI